MAEITLQDKLLGKLAIHNNLISQNQLDECLELISNSKKGRPLGVVLLSKGYITDDILADLTRIQHQNEMQRDIHLNRRMEDIIFKKLVLRQKLLSKLQIKNCLEEQQRLEKLGQYLRLGQVMVRKKYLTTKDFLKILEQQKTLLFRCKSCEATFELSTALNGKKFRCANCETIITVPDILKNILYPKRSSSTHNSKGFHPLKSVRDRIIEAQYFGRFKVIEEIARGGMGIVFLAKNEQNQNIALKVLKEGESSTRDQIRRFQREAESAAKLHHPYIVTVYETGIEDDCHYFTMEYVDGSPLDDASIQETLTQHEFLEVIAKIAEALHYAHKKGIVHRDIKPANILITRETKQPKLTDFGLAKDLDRQTMLTQSGAMVGTLYYMSPEQVKGGSRKIDGRTDIYALGVILYEYLTDSLPFSGETTLEIYDKIVNEEAVPLRALNENIDQDLQNIVLKALAKDPPNRYQTGEAFAADLTRYIAGEKVSAKAEFFTEKIRRFVVRNLGTVLTVLVCGFFLLATIIGYFLFREYSNLRDYQNYLELGIYYERKGSFVLAKEQFSLAAEIFPQKIEPLFHRAIVSITNNQLDETRKDLEKVIQLDPTHPKAYFLLGKIFCLAGQRTEGKAQIELFDQAKIFFEKSKQLMITRPEFKSLQVEIRELEQVIQNILQKE